MRVCDRHNRTKAVTTLIVESTDSHMDICDECLFQLTEWMGDVSRQSVEPKKKKGFFKK